MSNEMCRSIKKETFLAWLSVSVSVVSLAVASFAVYLQMGPTQDHLNAVSSHVQALDTKIGNGIRIFDKKLREIKIKKEERKDAEGKN